MAEKMNFEFRLEENCPSDWNTNLLKSDLGNIFNTFEYSQYANKRLGWKPFFLSIINPTGNLIAETVLFEITSTKLGKLSKLAKKIIHNKLSKLRWIYGPIVIPKENPSYMVNAFLKYLSKSNRKLYGTTHPLLGINFENYNLTFEKWSTFLLDLTQPKDTIIQNMDKRSVIKNIKRSEDRGVKLYEITDSSIAEYHNLLNEFRSQGGNPTYDFGDTEELWRLLKPLGFGGYLAKKDNIAIGGIMFSYFNRYINEWGIARSKKDTDEKLYAQDLLKWKIIEWGINTNQKFYDFSGANPYPRYSKEDGILKYKRKWGGVQKFYYLVSN